MALEIEIGAILGDLILIDPVGIISSKFCNTLTLFVRLIMIAIWFKSLS